MNNATSTLPLALVLLPVKVDRQDTNICNDQGHGHADPHQDIYHITANRHQVVIETERHSGVYTVWVDSQREEADTFITGAELYDLLKSLLEE
jgi:hypothetical protein